MMDRVWTPIELVQWTATYLSEKGFEDPRLNAELLLAGVLRIKRLDLYLQFDRPLTGEELAEFKARLKRRLRHEPLQYIEGTAQFRDLTLKVDSRVLIPRPETELLIDRVLAWAGDRIGLDVLDVGTGSGAIALSLRIEGRFGRVVASDISGPALDLARANAGRAGATDVDFRLGAFYHPIQGERFDVIVSNPPYVGESERSELAAEVREWEPAMALFGGGDDGLDAIREIVGGAPAHLKSGGLLALEIGAAQAVEVVRIVDRTGEFGTVEVCRDFAGRDRMVLVQRRDVRSGAATPTIINRRSQLIGYTSGTSS